MPNEIEGVAPESLEAKALAELQKEGHEIGTHQPDSNDGEIKDTPIPPKEPVIDNPPQEEIKPERIPTMVEAWKLKVAEDQKANLEKDLIDLKAKVEELSKQKDPITQTQKLEISEEIKNMAEEAGIDANFLTKFAEAILQKAKPSEDLRATIKDLQEEKELIKQDNLYSKEFENDILPLVKDYGLSGQALSQLKSSLKDMAFSETYAKVPLKEIFKLKEDTFDLKVSKKSAEGRGVKIRTEVVDIENIDEEQFKNLSYEQVEKLEKQKTSGGWK